MTESQHNKMYGVRTFILGKGWTWDIETGDTLRGLVRYRYRCIQCTHRGRWFRHEEDAMTAGDSHLFMKHGTTTTKGEA